MRIMILIGLIACGNNDKTTKTTSDAKVTKTVVVEGEKASTNTTKNGAGTSLKDNNASNEETVTTEPTNNTSDGNSEETNK